MNIPDSREVIEMGNFKVIAKDVREQIVNRIKNEGVSAAQAARDAGVSAKTVYNRLARGVAKEPGIMENNKLKRENRFLMQLIGKLTMEKEQLRGKK